MRRIHVQGIGRLPTVAKNLPEWGTGRRWDDPQWTVHQTTGPAQARPVELDEAAVVEAVTRAALADAGVSRADVGFICSGSNDYHQGRPFSFVMALDGAGAWPPKRESHVEMDGAWALYEAFVRLQHGDVDVALVYAFGRSSVGDTDAVSTMQLDPYFTPSPGPSPLSLVALQARLMMQEGLLSEADLAKVVSDRYAAARRSEHAAVWGGLDEAELLAAPTVSSPLRAHDAPVQADGAAAIVLVADGAGPLLSGIAHQCEPMDFGSRQLTRSTSTRGAWQSARDLSRKVGRGGKQVDIVMTAAGFSPHAVLLERELGVNGGLVDPYGGAMVGDVPMVTGLNRIAAAAEEVRGGATRALAHATQGPCLQQNLVAILEHE